ncbi:hypothetical protein [Actinoplanes sp. NPDC049802]|uniref:hypothetical protein n=1 Tax=Actinoplanes sp. NPDC049802 TaxID=3154742 RepID=UPI0033D685A7
MPWSTSPGTWCSTSAGCSPPNVVPGHLHDTSCARDLGVTAALDWAAAELVLPALADSGYEGTGQGIKTPVKQPADGEPLAIDDRACSRLLRALRRQANAASPS